MEIFQLLEPLILGTHYMGSQAEHGVEGWQKFSQCDWSTTCSSNNKPIKLRGFCFHRAHVRLDSS